MSDLKLVIIYLSIALSVYAVHLLVDSADISPFVEALRLGGIEEVL